MVKSIHDGSGKGTLPITLMVLGLIFVGVGFLTLAFAGIVITILSMISGMPL